MFQLPAIYPITDRRLSGLSHLETVERLVAGGATLIQLREKTNDARAFYEAVAAAIAYARPRDVKILVNDRVDVALAAGADGVHLGQDDLPPAAARQILGNDAIIGFSTHSVAQAIEAEHFPVDYIAIGPVFTTTTKENPDPVVGLEGVRGVRAQITKPLVAIGGITGATMNDVFAAGADSVALISELFPASGDIAERFQDLLNRLRPGFGDSAHHG